MADFRPARGESKVSFDRSANIFTLAPGSTGDIALWGGGPNGEDLTILSWNEAIVEARDLTFVTVPLGSGLHRIRLTAKNAGRTEVEGRVGENGPAWAKATVVVGGASGGDAEEAIRLLETEAINFSARWIVDSKVRTIYVKQAQAYADELRDAIARGELTPATAARRANAMRNEILEAARLRSSDIGRAAAEQLKRTGKGLTQLQTHYAKKLFNAEFEQLTQRQRNAVFLEIVNASGRANEKVTLRAARYGKLGRGLLVLSVGISVYNIATSEDKLDATGREAAGLGGGIVGGAAAGAVAGLACGPGAPICIGVFVFVGGALGALGADLAYDGIFH